MKAAFLFALALPSPLQAAEEHAAANPIRKVVNMLQMMQKKVEAEGEKEQELFDKFMCYCKNSGGDLAAGIADAETKVSELPSAVEEAEGQLAQLKEDLKQHQADRSAAKAAMASATALRKRRQQHTPLKTARTKQTLLPPRRPQQQSRRAWVVHSCRQPVHQFSARFLSLRT